MSNTIYVTEPQAIDIQRAERYVGDSEYTFIPGNTRFEGAEEDCRTLLLRSETHIGADIKQYFPKLTNIIRVGTGLDNIDLNFCRENAINVYNAAGANADAVAEYVVSMLLYASRSLYMLEKRDVEQWNRFKFRGSSIAGKTIGIIGFGNIGRLLRAKLRGLGCSSFLIHDPYLPSSAIEDEDTHAQSLEEVLKGSDVVSLHIPLTDDTKYIIGADMLHLCKPDLMLVNASRGGIVHEEALIHHMKHNPRMIYIADTVEDEPNVHKDLLERGGVLVTPHIASLTSDAEVAMLERALQNFVNHQPVRA